MKNKTIPTPRIEPAHTPEKFAERYHALCKEFGMRIVFEPRWVQSKDQGDYRLVILSSVMEMSKNG